MIHMNSAKRLRSFGTPGYIRVSYCVQTKQIEDALPAFKKLAEEYK